MTIMMKEPPFKPRTTNTKARNKKKKEPIVHKHQCDEMKKSIKDRIHEPDLHIYYNEEFAEFADWYLYHDRETVYITIRYCPFCSMELLIPSKP
jgi:hypothetical protein